MELKTIEKMVNALVHTVNITDKPEIVMIYSENKKWYAKEQYVRRDPKGNVIPRSGTYKIIPLGSSAEYKPPEGFHGVIINEGDLVEYD